MVAKKILTEEEIEEMEDREDIEAADRAMDEIEAGEVTIPWAQVRAELLARRQEKKAA